MCLGLNCTILATYVKFSNRITPKYAKKATKQLKNHASGQSELLMDSDTEDEERARLRASKRISVYREMADEQIRSILATMMTISKDLSPQ